MNKEDLIRLYQNTDVDIVNILKAQKIAERCLDHMTSFLQPSLSRKEIHEECARYMTALGSEGWWIHNDPALILYGDLTAYSGHEDPSPLFEGKLINENDFITIDVAPMIKTGWGDLARSFVMEEGRIINWKDCHNSEIIEGMETELYLHQLFIDTVNEDTTYEQLHDLNDRALKEKGYVNCDYHGNFGHTIENDPKDRVTIDKGATLKIAGYGKPLTFEPHIHKKDGSYGIKHENMYVFFEGKMRLIP